MTLEIIQSDREIAAEALEALGDTGGAAIVREGRWDSYWLVQAIARARISGWNAAVEAAAQMKVSVKLPLGKGIPDGASIALSAYANAICNLRLDQEGKDDE